MYYKILAFFLICFCTKQLFAQQMPLPIIDVKRVNNNVIISWTNEYKKPIIALNIQRSYDSLKNFRTIGTVLSPQNVENGYSDVNPPYNKMYYRVFVSFAGGTYIYTNTMMPVKDTSTANTNIEEKYPWLIIDKKDDVIEPPVKSITPSYPSTNIFTAKDNNVIIHLFDAAYKKYSVRFYDENDNFLFEIKRVKDDYLIIEKVNFVHAGWFHFEIFDDGEFVEKNKFQILKDIKKI